MGLRRKRKCDDFRIDPSIRNIGKRRLLRLRADGTKRQCWELSRDEVYNLWLMLGRHIDVKTQNRYYKQLQKDNSGDELPCLPIG